MIEMAGEASNVSLPCGVGYREHPALSSSFLFRHPLLEFLRSMSGFGLQIRLLGSYAG